MGHSLCIDCKVKSAQKRGLCVRCFKHREESGTLPEGKRRERSAWIDRAKAADAIQIPQAHFEPREPRSITIDGIEYEVDWDGT